uniref:Sulfhydryl oxidase n=1 Tax=Panulirus argus virus 1 TaxID=380624 RepID=A0A6G9HEP1_9VIRU|nr:sulfhydryl/thiol Oxidoreductase (ERV1/ALR/poxvirus E10 family) [Panulirus argus virus 1]
MLLWTDTAGPSCWRLLHYIAVTNNRCSDRTKEWKHNAIRSILESVPCDSCRKEALRRWHGRTEGLELFLYNFHNDVNARLRYPPFPITSLGMYRDPKEIERILTRDLFLTKIHSLRYGQTWFKDVFDKLLDRDQQQAYLRYETTAWKMIREERQSFEDSVRRKILEITP